MNIHLVKYFVIIFLLMLFSCNNNEIIDTNIESVRDKDTLKALDIIEELNADVWGNLEVTFLDKKNNVIDGITDNKDTFFLIVNYKSDKFKNLVKNSTLTLIPLTDNCTITNMDDKFRLIVNSHKLIDTIEYEVHLKSSKFVFRSMHNEDLINDEIRLITFYETFSLKD